MPTKFDFISPGVQLREIDESQVPQTPENPGILLIGRARSGPAMKPVRVKDWNAFVDTFGKPIDGVRQDDPWRLGNTGAPNYAAYAAQAYLAAGVGPVNYVRLLGKSNGAGGADAAGWNMGSSFGPALGKDITHQGARRVSSSAAAYGLFIIPSQSETGVASAQLRRIINPTDGVGPGTFQVNIPTTAGGLGTVTITIEDPINATPAADNISILSAAVGTAKSSAAALLEAFNGGGVPANVVYGSGTGAGNYTTGLPGVTSTLQVVAVGNAEAISLTGTLAAGAYGNGIQVIDGTLTAATQGDGGTTPMALTGGISHMITTGSLAAIFYTSGSAFAVSGTLVSGSTTAVTQSLSASALIQGNDGSHGVNLYLSGSATLDPATGSYSVNFTDYSNKNYIRNRLNTDPTEFFNQTNYGTSLTNQSYFLGETFDVNVNRLGGGAGTSTYYFIAGLGNAGAADFDNFNLELQEAKSGWFIGAKPSSKYLFRLIALDSGEEFQNKFYCKIANIRLATVLQPRATFTLQLIRRGVTESKDSVEEEFTGLTLDPDSAKYIIKQIGDINHTWNSAEEKFDITGLYPNQSNFFRVEMATNSGIVATDVPVGFIGPNCPANFSITPTTAATNNSGSAWCHGSGSIPMGNWNADGNGTAVGGTFIEGWPTGRGVEVSASALIKWPRFGMTALNTNWGQNYAATKTFGLRHIKSNSGDNDRSFQDIARRRKAINPHLDEGAATGSASFVFTLEDVRSGSVTTNYYWDEGSYAAGYSVAGTAATPGVSNAIDTNIKQFAVPFFGGFDGVDVRYADPFSNDRLDAGDTRYPYYTVEEAIDMVRDPEQVRYEMISKPGLLKASLVQKIVTTAEERGDALAIIDIKGIHQAPVDNGGTEQAASLSKIVTQLNTVYAIDSSYACTYFPNVRLRDTESGQGTILRAPPSVAGIGAIAQSEKGSSPWFAPAGFNRGGLGNLGGQGGPIVLGTVDHLTKDNRDVLYESNINPIARFPATGDTVIFGQKTLQQTPSALDRINVRRLMIYLKRHIGDIAETVLFDQNVRATWLRFKSRAEAVLAEVKSELGIVEYKLVLDETTTTADLIDRNIMYAKVFVKPARSIEFIAVDFIITRSGVEF